MSVTIDGTLGISAPFYALPVGTLIDFAGSTAPDGYLACPLVATNISRTTYADLFAVIGTTWGVGDGSTTFGMPYFPADYATVQSNANVGTQTTGKVKNHTHQYGASPGVGAAGGATPIIYNGATYATSNPNSPEGGTDNLAAGVRVLKCVRYV
jgi:microcystin-dependent protein